VLNHVAIDRITGFAVDHELFNAVALASPVFATEVCVRWRDDEVDRCAVALLLLALRDAEEGWLWAGSRTTRGYGHIGSVGLNCGRLSTVLGNGRGREEHDIASGRIADLAFRLDQVFASWTSQFAA
jgi:CRISPR/Cas system CSM-associated protein Csm3 (group 7 of RAMP superfamily)